MEDAQITLPTGPDVIAMIGWEDGAAGQVQAWLEGSNQCRVACFVNPDHGPPRVDVAVERPKRDARLFDFPERERFKGRPLLSSTRWPGVLASLGVTRVLVFVSDRHRRLELIDQATAAGLELVRAIHPTALIMEEAVVHPGAIVCARAVIGYRAEVHAGAVINTGAQVDHHGVVRQGAMLDPGVVAAGNVTVGRFAQVHTGAVIKNRIRIGEDAVVGAGAVVIRDVPPGVTVIGVPARPMAARDKPQPGGRDND